MLDARTGAASGLVWVPGTAWQPGPVCRFTPAQLPAGPGGDWQLSAYEGRQGTGVRRQYRPSVTVFDSLTHGRALPARAGPRRTAAPARRGGWPRRDGAS